MLCDEKRRVKLCQKNNVTVWTCKVTQHLSVVVLFLLVSANVTIRNTNGSLDTSASTKKSIQRKTSNVNNIDRFLQGEGNNTQLFDTLNEYLPIRIEYDTRLISYRYNNSDDENIKDEIRYIINTILPTAANIWSQHLYFAQSLERFNEIEIDGSECEVDTQFDDDTNLFSNLTTYNNIDIVFIIGGDLRNNCDTRQLAYARVCALDSVTDRPIVGILEFCLQSTKPSFQPTIYNVPIVPYYENSTNVKFDPDHLQISLLDVTIHEMIHVLGMSSNLFPYFRNEQGRPRMERDNETGWPIPITRRCGDGTNMSNEFEDLPSDDIVQVIQMNDGTYQQYLVTPIVQTIVRNHFNCSTLIGARLDDSSACISSHWHERLFYNDIMGPKASASSDNSLSLLTLALLADSGWYQVNFDNLTTHSGFGINAGCNFISQPCINSSTNQISDHVVDEFCDDPYLQLEPFTVNSTPTLLNHNIYCDPSYHSWTICDLVQYNDGTEIEKLYFSSSHLGPLNFTEADYCPIPAVGLGLDCRVESSSYTALFPGEYVGKNSRCINGYYKKDDILTFRPACMLVVCDENAQVVRIGEGVEMINCTIDQEHIPIPNRPDNSNLICPRLAALCPHMYSCPNGCYGKGNCIHTSNEDGSHSLPYCQCFDETNTDPSCASSQFAIYDDNTIGTSSPTNIAIASSPIVSQPSFTSRPDVTNTTSGGQNIIQHRFITLRPIAILFVPLLCIIICQLY